MTKLILNLKRTFSTSFYYFISNEELKNMNYTKPKELYVENGLEYGRNFGMWKCLNCKRNWSSAYTWISTSFSLNNNKIAKSKTGKLWFYGENLENKDFILQKCKECNDNLNIKIIGYSNLESGNTRDTQRAHLAYKCMKCLKGFPCIQTHKK